MMINFWLVYVRRLVFVTFFVLIATHTALSNQGSCSKNLICMCWNMFWFYQQSWCILISSKKWKYNCLHMDYVCSHWWDHNTETSLSIKFQNNCHLLFLMHFGSESSHYENMPKTVFLFYINKRKDISKNGQNHPYITNAKDIIFRLYKGSIVIQWERQGGGLTSPIILHHCIVLLF